MAIFVVFVCLCWYIVWLDVRSPVMNSIIINDDDVMDQL